MMCNYLIAQESEISKIKKIEDLILLSIIKYEVSAGYGGFEMVYALSRLFYQDEIHIPKKLEIDILGVKRIFQYEKAFISKIASFEKKQMDDFAYILRKDKYCINMNYVGMGIWNFLYEFYNCCEISFNKNLNLYVVEEEEDYISYWEVNTL